jgi:hypothetical protein
MTHLYHATPPTGLPRRKKMYPANRASTRNLKPTNSERDKSYDAGYQGRGANRTDTNTDSDGTARRSQRGLRICHCGARLKVSELNAHYKAHLAGTIPAVLEDDDD